LSRPRDKCGERVVINNSTKYGIEKNSTIKSKKLIKGIKNPKTKINETINYSETEAKI
jgi:hypothetical protein